MTPPRSIVGTLVDGRLLGDTRRRRLVFLVLTLVFGLLALFPRHYLATTTLAPQDSSTAGLSSILASLGANYAAILGNHQPVEIDLQIARSVEVREAVIKRLGLAGRSGYRDRVSALRRLEDKMEIRALRGSIVEISAKDRDPDFALSLVTAFAVESQRRLARLSRDQTAYKRAVLNDRMAEASDRLSRAEAALNSFRRANRLTDPEEQLATTSGRLSGLQAALNAKRLELATARQFATDDSMKVKSILTEIAALRVQLAEAQTLNQPGNAQTVAGTVSKTTQYDNLNRDLRFAQSLYESYTRYLEGTAIEQLTADYNMRFLEEPYVDPDRQFNLLPLAILLVVVALALACEFYLLRPPVGAARSIAR